LSAAKSGTAAPDFAALNPGYMAYQGKTGRRWISHR
jgi:hypothetical protein